MSLGNRFIATPAVALAMMLVLSACDGSEASGSAPSPIPVLVTTVRHVARPEQRVLTATVRARVETELGFRVSGRIAQRLVDVGDSVKAGQALARLDASDYALGVQAATDQVRAASAEAEQAASEEARLGRLLADGSVSTADHERQRARAAAAAAVLDQSRRNLELARNRTGYTTLVAPYAGVVTSLRMEVGQVVGEGLTVVSLARDGEREIVADVPEDVVGRIRQMDAVATPWHGGDPIELKLREVSPMASVRTGTFQVRYAMADPDLPPSRALVLGATARLRLSIDGATGAVLPVSALVKASGGLGVWVVDAITGGVLFQPVQVQGFDPDAARVSGLRIGARVVTVGAQKLDAAMKVTPVERNAEVRSADLTATGDGT